MDQAGPAAARQTRQTNPLGLSPQSHQHRKGRQSSINHATSSQIELLLGLFNAFVKSVIAIAERKGHKLIWPGHYIKTILLGYKRTILTQLVRQYIVCRTIEADCVQIIIFKW